MNLSRECDQDPEHCILLKHLPTLYSVFPSPAILLPLQKKKVCQIKIKILSCFADLNRFVKRKHKYPHWISDE
jgi:hypothetical protein